MCMDCFVGRSEALFVFIVFVLRLQGQVPSFVDAFIVLTCALGHACRVKAWRIVHVRNYVAGFFWQVLSTTHITKHCYYRFD